MIASLTPGLYVQCRGHPMNSLAKGCYVSLLHLFHPSISRIHTPLRMLYVVVQVFQ